MPRSRGRTWSRSPPWPVGTRAPCSWRSVAFSSVSLDDTKALKSVHDVKVNDVVLAMVGGALRAYLEHHDELPEESLVVGVPISTRSDDDDELDNKIANMAVSVATDIDDPVERLLQIYKNTQKSKELTRAVRAKKIQAMGDTFPPSVLNLAFRTVTLAPPVGFPNAKPMSSGWS